MSDKNTSYKQIVKATSIFGGVQVFNIFITLIRSKVLAILIGSAGMGLNGLLMSSLNLIKTISALGISESAVRDLSKAHNSGDDFKIAKTFTVFKRWIWVTAFLGVILTIGFSPLLSKLTFGNYDHVSSYIWLSITFIFGALSGGIYTLLRGTRQLKYMAQANMFGALLGLLVALPIFYFYGIDGVVPAILATAFGNYLVSIYFTRKIKFQKVSLNIRDTFILGKPMVALGVSLTLVSLLAAGITFVLSAFISSTGSLKDLGLYNAGVGIVDGYVGMVFTAMAADYFPRLSGLINDEIKWKELVNQQAELVLIILGIVLVLLISTTPFLIRLLLSDEFSGAQDFIFWSVLALPLKGLVWVVGYIVVAKGDNKLFFIVETFANLLVLGFNVLFYYFFGLNGLGISLLLSFIITTIMMLWILKSKYGFYFNIEVYLLLFKLLIALSICMFSIKFLGYPNAYYVEALVVLITIFISLLELNKRMNLKETFNNIKFKILKK